MAGGSAYQQRKHKKITGLVNAQRASKCFNCGSVYEYGTLLRGWCATCIANWTTAAPTPAPRYATHADAVAAGASVCPVSARQIEHIKEYALAPKNDREFIPLTMFQGGVSIGQVQTWMNVIHAMKTIEAKSTTEARAIVTALPDAAHICGRHHRMGADQIRGFFNRLNSASAFVVDTDTRDYLRGFIRDNRLLMYMLSPIKDFDRRARRAWRVLRKTCRQCSRVLGPHRSVFCSEPCATGYRNEQARLRPSRAGQQSRKIPAVWPFLSQAATREHELLLKVDCAVPKSLPHQMREDVCQDLIVSVLSGEVSIDQLQGSVAKHIANVFKMHPTKYGPLSLDQPPPWANGDDRPLSELLRVDPHDEAEWDSVSGADGLTDALEGPIRDAFGEIIYMPGRLTTDYARLINAYGKEPLTTYSEPNALTVLGDNGEAIPFWRPHVEEEAEDGDNNHR